MNKKHFFLIILITVVMFSFVTVRLDIVKTSYKIHDLEKDIRKTHGDIGLLTAKLNELKSPRRLEAIAKHTFQMKVSQPNQTIVLSEEKTDTGK